MLKKINWKAVVAATGVMVISSIVYSICGFALLLAKVNEPESAQALLSGDSFFQTHLMLEGGGIGLLGLFTGYVFGPFLAGCLLGRFVSMHRSSHILIFSGIIMLLWSFSIVTEPTSQGVGSAILFMLVGAISIILGGFLTPQKRITTASMGARPASDLEDL